MSELLLARLLPQVRSKLTPLMYLLLEDQCPLLARNLVELTMEHFESSVNRKVYSTKFLHKEPGEISPK